MGWVVLKTIIPFIGIMVIAGCVTVPHTISERESHWRNLLQQEAPVGSEKARALSFFERHDLPATKGTYRVVSSDGRETSNCRLPERALSAMEWGAARGLYLNWDIEITVCLDEFDRVERHFVGAWNAGI